VDRVALRGALFQRLEEVLGNLPDGTFDQSYWTNVYHDGIDPLIKVPRDIVRLTNTLLVTYPAVAGEVNVVDFIALETLRVFLPNVYNLIRSNPERIAGHGRDQGNGGEGRDAPGFRQVLIEKVPEQVRESTINMLERIFPKIGQMEYGHDWLSGWRRSLRACHPDLFATYFRLSLSPGSISRNEVESLLVLAGAPEKFGQALLQAKEVKRPDGTSKARAVLERLMDHVSEDISLEHAPGVVQALLDVGDLLIDPADDRGMYDMGGNITRCTRPAYHLLKRIEEGKRESTLAVAIAAGHAIVVQARLLRALEEEVVKEKSDDPLLSLGAVEKIKEIWVDRVKELSAQEDFVSKPELSSVLRCWLNWGDKEDVKAWASRVIVTDHALFRLVGQFLQHTRSNTVGDWAVRLQPRLNPAWLKDYIDTAACAVRLQELERSENVPHEYREAVSQYLKENEMLEKGVDPDGFDAFDD
jgi:predicted KAP-like P-loop ATPase